MRFVDGHQGDGQFLHQAAKALRLQALRRDVEELARASPDAAIDVPVFLRIQGGVQKGGGDPGLGQGGDLVLHQGDQGRNHQGQPRQQQGRELVADGLSGPGGHDADDVPVVEQGVHQGLLTGAEVAVAVILLQEGSFGVHGMTPYRPGPPGLRDRAVR